MARWRWLPPTLLGIGILVLLGAAALLSRAYASPAQGLEDLGYVVGAMLLAAASGVAFAGHLLATRLRGAGEPRRGLLVVAALGVAPSGLAASPLAMAAIESGNGWLALVMGGILALLLAGLGAGARSWRAA